MKKVLFIILIFSVCSWGANDWLTQFEEAKESAAKTNKKIMLYFSGSDWCRPCILLKKKVFQTNQFEKFAANNLVLVMLDFPAREQNKLSDEQTRHNEEMAEKYNADGNFPLIVIVTQEGKKLSEFIGYGNETADEYIARLKKVISTN